ncbi:MAG TPA: hypothetical protein PKY03_03935 [Moraxellaceae bacterium]|nr:hypothetical protein [Moraxellaceae bacterium]
MNASVGKDKLVSFSSSSSDNSPRVKDYVGMWYEARRRCGVDDSMWFGFYEFGEPTPVWKRRSHRFSDGIGALSELLLERGHDSGALPVSRNLQKPDWRALWRTRQVIDAPVTNIKWNHLDVGQQHSQGHAPVSLLLSIEQTQQIEATAAAVGVSLTMWLLWTADRASRSILADSNSIMSWVFPVNLRGAVDCGHPRMNHSSGLMVTLARDMAPTALRAQISARFARYEHWRTWFSLNLGRYIGQLGISALYRLVKGTPGRHTGSYSNLGEWNAPHLDGIACSAPGSPAYPVSVSTVLCNKRRTFACRLHPVIGGSSERSIEFLTLWRELSCTTDALSGW